MKGFSKRNLELIRQWYLFYSQIAKQAVAILLDNYIGIYYDNRHNHYQLKLGGRYVYRTKLGSGERA